MAINLGKNMSTGKINFFSVLMGFQDCWENLFISVDFRTIRRPVTDKEYNCLIFNYSNCREQTEQN